MSDKPYSCIVIDRGEGSPARLQIERHIEFRVAIGALRPGDLLPSAPALSRDLGVNHQTVHSAYSALQKQGTIRGVVGTGSFVSEHPKTPELLKSVIRTELSPAIVFAKSIGCSREDVRKVVASLLDELYPKKRS